MIREPQTRSGMALILTLAAIVLAGGLALLLQSRAMELSRREQVALTHERLRIAAAEAAREMLLTLASDEDLKVDHPGEDWAIPRETTGDDGISTWAKIEDAGRYFNWNNLAVSGSGTRTPSDILADLMIFCGEITPVTRVDALKDFLDEDEEGTYESPFYQDLDEPYEAPSRVLWVPSELLWVHDFSPELFRHRPRTDSNDLFGGDLADSAVLVPAAIEKPIPVNVNTAGRDVLMAMTGLQQDSAVRTLLALREVQPFESLTVLFMASPEAGAALGDSVSTGSTYFRVTARASLGAQAHAVSAWVERDEQGDIDILQWIEEEG